jgi:hypothetical protein
MSFPQVTNSSSLLISADKKNSLELKKMIRFADEAGTGS